MEKSGQEWEHQGTKRPLARDRQRKNHSRKRLDSVQKCSPIVKRRRFSILLSRGTKKVGTPWVF